MSQNLWLSLSVFVKMSKTEYNEVRVSEDEMFAACMIEDVHPLDLSWLFPLALKTSLNLKRLVHYELKLYQNDG